MSFWDNANGQGFWDEPEDWELGAIPRYANDHPKIRRRDDPTKYIWPAPQRPSKLGKILDETFALERAEKEKIVWAMGRHEHLQMRAAAVRGPGGDADPRTAVARAGDESAKAAIKADREELREIAREAYKFAGGDSAATKGTAVHSVYYWHNLANPISDVKGKLEAALTKRSELLRGWKIHASEVFVVWDCDSCSKALGRLITHTGGSLDAAASPLGIYEFEDTHTKRTVRLTPDDIVLLDDKSGLWDVRGVTYGCQMPCYGFGTPYVHVSDQAAKEGDDGRRSWESVLTNVTPTQKINREWMLIPHVPIESLQDAGLHWVNLPRASEFAHLAITASQARNHVHEVFCPPGEMSEALLTFDGWRVAEEMSVDDEPLEEILRDFEQGEKYVTSPETTQLHEVMTVNGLIKAIGAIDGDDAGAQIRALYDQHEALWTPYLQKKATARMHELGLSVPAPKVPAS